MLLELKVKDFAIIDSIQLSFTEGLNILSGETGAGKSVLLKSLALLMGGKAPTDSVRSGAEQAVIEGFFDITSRPDIQEKLKFLGIPQEEDQLVVRRIISPQGKSKIFLNESLTTLNNLQTIVCPLIEVTGQAIPLIEITGQHENRHLLSAGYQLDLVDQFAGLANLRQKYQEQFKIWQDLQKQKEELEKNGRDRNQRLDFLTFQRDEISALDLKDNEELEIEREYARLKNSSKLSDLLETCTSLLEQDEDSALARVQKTLAKCNELSLVAPDATELTHYLQEAKVLVEEFLFELNKKISSSDNDPQKLEALESRLNSLRKLQRKFGGSSSEILQTLIQIDTEIKKLENLEEVLAGIDKNIQKLKLILQSIAAELHEKRMKAAKKLSQKINLELEDLNMKGLTFDVAVEKTETLHSLGFSNVEFLTKSSEKDSARSLSKYASGGELSRILLSLKYVIGQGQIPRSYLFDEVDTGVSGPTAEKVGRKLRAIAKGQQVLCVTHLPQVAACADHHYYIQKKNVKSGVHMEVQLLKEKDRVQEIARLISGAKITPTSLAHAKQLLKN